MDATTLHDEVLKLNRIGIALTSMHNLDALLEMIVREARALTGADAGSLYLREGDRLHFAISQNDSLRKRLGEQEERKLFSPFTLPMTTGSIAGFVACTKQNLNLQDDQSHPSVLRGLVFQDAHLRQIRGLRIK